MITKVKKEVSVRKEFLKLMHECKAKESKNKSYQYVIKTILGKYHVSLCEGEITGYFEDVQIARKILWCHKRTGVYNFSHEDKNVLMDNFKKFIMHYVTSPKYNKKLT